MKFDKKAWIDGILSGRVKKAMPILSFPSVTLMGISVKDLISDSATQARAMKLIADRCDTLASVSMMDLSVEAEAFGSTIKFSDDEVPTVLGAIVRSPEDAKNLKTPAGGARRTGLYTDAIAKAAALITDRPVFAGVIGPFSLAGRLMDMTEIMVNCYEDPDMVHETLRKASEFILSYARAFKAAGADGVVMAEPAAGLLSPEIANEFSSRYVKPIANALKDDGFAFIYHNCGKTVPLCQTLLSIGADAYHFGNAIDIEDIFKIFPAHIPVMGNISPAERFRNGAPAEMAAAVRELLGKCSKYPNFVISSGCDIPPLSPWANIDMFFKTVKDFYGN
ncbi:MAG: uroporphyrinogen decarboxylase family protein [Firmicutes bacterium]|nr:uroporphyrinogen decarboxylase family protein [Bacillota bacterium]